MVELNFEFVREDATVEKLTFYVDKENIKLYGVLQREQEVPRVEDAILRVSAPYLDPENDLDTRVTPRDYPDPLAFTFHRATCFGLKDVTERFIDLGHLDNLRAMQRILYLAWRGKIVGHWNFKLRPYELPDMAERLTFETSTYEYPLPIQSLRAGESNAVGA